MKGGWARRKSCWILYSLNKEYYCWGPSDYTPQNRLFSRILFQNVYSRLRESMRRRTGSFVVALGLRWRLSVCFLFSWISLFGSECKQKRTWTKNLFTFSNTKSSWNRWVLRTIPKPIPNRPTWTIRYVFQYKIVSKSLCARNDTKINTKSTRSSHSLRFPIQNHFGIAEIAVCSETPQKQMQNETKSTPVGCAWPVLGCAWAVPGLCLALPGCAWLCLSDNLPYLELCRLEAMALERTFE